MKSVFALLTTLALLCLGVAAQANVFSLGSGLTNLETVRVGDPGNAADTTGYGSVGYTYSIGKYEITTAQYVDFLNQKAQWDNYNYVLWSSNMADPYFYTGCNIQRSGSAGNYKYTVGSGSSQDVAAWGNRPVNYVCYWSACRFVNWLSNGQGDGNTETGAYTLTNSGINSNIITRNAGATWALTSEDEWYKAAFYKGGAANAGYWGYATQSSISPASQVLSPDPGNSANYKYAAGHTYYRSNVGEFENSASAYGTFDQNGNVSEWNEAIVGQQYRGLRGGSYGEQYDGPLQASHRGSTYPWIGSPGIGFRVVQLEPVPEPSSILALAAGLVSLAGIRRRRP